MEYQLILQKYAKMWMKNNFSEQNLVVNYKCMVIMEILMTIQSEMTK
jgi:hypothetical protein